jgi:hypothetical protein
MGIVSLFFLSGSCRGAYLPSFGGKVNRSLFFFLFLSRLIKNDSTC